MVEAKQKDLPLEEEDEEFKDESFIDKPAILDKYKAAALITQSALQRVIAQCTVGSDIFKIC
jgi:hypothetical protein